MEYIFLIAAFNAFFFAILLYQKRPMALHDKILVLWLCYLGLFTGIYGLFYYDLFTKFPLLSAGFISLLMLHGPFLYLYISSLITKTKSFPVNSLFHFCPFILFNIYLLITSLFPEVSERIRLDHVEVAHEPPVIFLVFLILTAFSGPLYFWFSVRLFKTLDINIFNNFSYSEKVNPVWLRKLVYIFGIVWTFLMAIAAIHHVFHMFSWVFCADGITLSLSVFIILMGYYGLKQKEIFSDSGNEPFVTNHNIRKYSGSGLREDEAKMYSLKLSTYMDKEKPYLNPDINLPQLAKDLGIPSHYLSQVINENSGHNFFDYINRYRVDDIKLKIVDPDFDNLSLLGIAFESGFNSKSAFNRVFKNITGQTPSEYKKNMQNESHLRK